MRFPSPWDIMKCSSLEVRHPGQHFFQQKAGYWVNSARREIIATAWWLSNGVADFTQKHRVPWAGCHNSRKQKMCDIRDGWKFQNAFWEPYAFTPRGQEREPRGRFGLEKALLISIFCELNAVRWHVVLGWVYGAIHMCGTHHFGALQKHLTSYWQGDNL